MILLVAPPASGKTTLVKQMLDKGLLVIFVAPLTAIISELKEKIQSWGYRPLLFSEHPGRSGDEFFSGFDCVLFLPEQTFRLFSSVETLPSRAVVVLDEFHLFYYWGETFRPRLWEGLVQLLHFSSTTLALTATFDRKNLECMLARVRTLGESVSVIDLGNRSLKYLPRRTFILFSFPLQMAVAILFMMMKKRVLIFCRTRREVRSLEYLFGAIGIDCLSCVGGETRKFTTELKQKGDVRVIVATTALSHGVNLPPVNGIFITYHEENTDIYLQMVARGGRRGESFQLFVPSRRFKTLLSVDSVSLNGTKNRRTHSQKKSLGRTPHHVRYFAEKWQEGYRYILRRTRWRQEAQGRHH